MASLRKHQLNASPKSNAKRSPVASRTESPTLGGLGGSARQTFAEAEPKDRSAGASLTAEPSPISESLAHSKGEFPSYSIVKSLGAYKSALLVSRKVAVWYVSRNGGAPRWGDS